MSGPEASVWALCKRETNSSGVATHACNQNTWEVEAVRLTRGQRPASDTWQAGGQPRLHDPISEANKAAWVTHTVREPAQ